MDENSYFNTEMTTVLLFAVLVNKLGGEVEITQSDIDAVSYNTLQEERIEDKLTFKLLTRSKQ